MCVWCVAVRVRLRTSSSSDKKNLHHKKNHKKSPADRLETVALQLLRKFGLPRAEWRATLHADSKAHPHMRHVAWGPEFPTELQVLV